MTKRLSRRHFLALSAGSAGAGLLAACASPAEPSPTVAPRPLEPTKAPQLQVTPQATSAPSRAPAATTKAPEFKRGGTFTLAKTSTIKNFDPMDMFVGNHVTRRALFNTLIKYDANLNPQPELAEKWDSSADGKVVTLKLRQGVKFHSGREFTSQDVKNSVEFTVGNASSALRPLFLPIKRIEMPDKYTVTLGFDTVNPGALDLLDVLYIIDKETIQDNAKMAVGTGPFKLDKYVPNDRVEFVANPEYWNKGKPYMDRFVVRQVPDLAALAINVESGAVDAIWQPSYLDLLRLKEQSTKYTTSMGAPGASVVNVGLNTKLEPFTIKKVRQAVAWAIDRARFCKTTMQGLVEPSCLIWPSNSWAYFEDLEGKIGYDLDKATALLKEAGVDKGFDTEILCSTAIRSGDASMAQILQADLKKLDINAKISDVDSAAYNARVNKPDIQIVVHAYGRANRDPGSTLTGAKAWLTESEGGWTRFESDAYSRLRDDLNSTLDREQRKAVARKIQELALDECFTNPVASQPMAWVCGIHVKGFDVNLDNAPYVEAMWLNK